jgi:hypothetical protein
MLACMWPLRSPSAGDAITAEDSHRFLLRFMERFPAYRHRDLFLSGESYAGHYVPMLAQSILRVRGRMVKGGRGARSRRDKKKRKGN